MDEVILSGYCRCLDAARTVLAEIENGELFADCAFGACPHEAACPIAQQLQQIKERDVR